MNISNVKTRREYMHCVGMGPSGYEYVKVRVLRRLPDVGDGWFRVRYFEGDEAGKHFGVHADHLCPVKAAEECRAESRRRSEKARRKLAERQGRPVAPVTSDFSSDPFVASTADLLDGDVEWQAEQDEAERIELEQAEDHAIAEAQAAEAWDYEQASYQRAVRMGW